MWSACLSRRRRNLRVMHRIGPTLWRRWKSTSTRGIGVLIVALTALAAACAPIMSFHRISPVQSTEVALVASDTTGTSETKQWSHVVEIPTNDVHSRDASDTV